MSDDATLSILSYRAEADGIVVTANRGEAPGPWTMSIYLRSRPHNVHSVGNVPESAVPMVFGRVLERAKAEDDAERTRSEDHQRFLAFLRSIGNTAPAYTDEEPF